MKSAIVTFHLETGPVWTSPLQLVRTTKVLYKGVSSYKALHITVYNEVLYRYLT